MSNVNTLSADGFTVSLAKIGKVNLYDVKFLQKHGKETDVISSLRLTELQLGILHQIIARELTTSIEYPFDVYREVDEELKEISKL